MQSQMRFGLSLARLSLLWLVLTLNASSHPLAGLMTAIAVPENVNDTLRVLQDIAGLRFNSWKVHIGPAENASHSAFDDTTWTEMPSTTPWAEVHKAFFPNEPAHPVSEVWLRGELVVPGRLSVIPLHRTGIQLHSFNRVGRVEIFRDGNLVDRFGFEGPYTVPQAKSAVLAHNAQPGQRLSVVIHITNLDSASDSDLASPPVYAAHRTEWSQREPLIDIRLTFDEIEEFHRATAEVLPSLELAQVLVNLSSAPGEGIQHVQSTTKWQRIYDNALRSIDLTALETQNFTVYMRSLDTCLMALRELDPLAKSFEINLIPLSHYFIGGGLPEGEAVKAVSENCRSLLQLLAERTAFKISQTQPGLHDLLQTYYPELHTALQTYAQQKRYEVTGGSWSGCNASLLSGESIIRQFLYGVHYIAGEYNLPTDTAVLPDTCGYAPNLPGLLQGCGIQNLMVIPSYPGLSVMPGRSANKPMPSHVFWWEGIDRSRLLVYIPPDGIQANLDRLDLIHHLASFAHDEDLHTCGIPIATPASSHLATDKWGWELTTPLLNQAESFFSLTPYPKVRFVTISEWFNALRRISESGASSHWPVWTADLASAVSRGSFAVQPRLKQRCQEFEHELLAAERYAAIASLFGFSYSQSVLNEGWVELLTHQSHPFMSGMASPEVYQTAMTRLAANQSEISTLIQQAQAAIGHHINTSLLMNPLIVHNPLPWKRDGAMEMPLREPVKQARVFDTYGTDIPCQLIQHHDGSQSLLIETRELPAMGFNTYQVDWDRSNHAKSGPLYVNRRKIENRWFSLELDKQSGGIHSLYDKANQQEVFHEEGGAYWKIIAEIPSRLAPWEERRGKTVLPGAADFTVLEKGPVRASVQATQYYGQSRLSQTFTLYAGSPWIDVDVEVEWNESLRILQLCFPLQTKVSSLICGTGNAGVERTGDTRNLPGVYWVDAPFFDRSYSLAIMNTGSCVYDISGQTLSLTVVRSPSIQPSSAEHGLHRFQYRLFPHSGKWDERKIPWHALELNQSLYALWESVHVGPLRPQWSGLEISDSFIICSAFKQAQDDPNAFLIRVYETSGHASNAIVTMPGKINKVLKCNHLESNPTPIPHSNATFETWLGAFETASYLVYLETK